jgi:hypothetical protein
MVADFRKRVEKKNVDGARTLMLFWEPNPTRAPEVSPET